MQRLIVFIVCAGCGATPTTDAVELRLQDRVDGAYVAACPQPDGVEAHRARGAERWRLEPAPSRSLGVPECAAPQPLPWTLPLSDGRIWSVDAKGLGLVEDGGYVFWRAAPSGLRAATWDGQVVYAVGDSGLWRWRPGPTTAAVPVPLPTALVDTALHGVFRDGDFLWVYDAQRRGGPLDVRGPVAVDAGPVGTLPSADRQVRAQLGAHAVSGTLGVAELVVDDQRWALAGPLQALLPDGDAIYVVAGRRLSRSVVGDEGARLVVAEVALPGDSVALFATGADTLIIVGVDYGFAQVRITPTSASARSPRPAR